MKKLLSCLLMLAPWAAHGVSIIDVGVTALPPSEATQVEVWNQTSSCVAINQLGQAACIVSNSGLRPYCGRFCKRAVEESVAARWNGVVLERLTELKSPYVLSWDMATAINNLGEVGGYSRVFSVNPKLWVGPGVLKPMPATPNAQLRDLNDRGDYILTVLDTTAGGIPHQQWKAFHADHAELTFPGFNVQPMALNNAGTMVVGGQSATGVCPDPADTDPYCWLKYAGTGHMVDQTALDGVLANAVIAPPIAVPALPPAPTVPVTPAPADPVVVVDPVVADAGTTPVVASAAVVATDATTAVPTTTPAATGTTQAAAAVVCPDPVTGGSGSGGTATSGNVDFTNPAADAGGSPWPLAYCDQRLNPSVPCPVVTDVNEAGTFTVQVFGTPYGGYICTPDNQCIPTGTGTGSYAGGAAPLAINNNGVAVGILTEPAYELTVQPVTHAVAWDSLGNRILLDTLLPPDSGWTLTAAYAINDAGQIAGVGVHNGLTRGFILTP